MSSEQDYNPTGYQDDENRTVRTSVEEHVTVKKKKSSWLPIVIFSILVLAALVVGASFFMKKSAPAPKPKPAATAPADTLSEESPAAPALPADGAAPADGVQAIDPITGLPVVADPNNPAAGQQPAAVIDPATGLPVAQPAAAAPAIDPATGLPVQQPATTAPAIDPATGLPVAQPAAVSVTQTTTTPPGAVTATQVTQTPAIDPATGLPVAQTQVTQTTVPAGAVPVPVVPVAPAVEHEEPVAVPEVAHEQAEPALDPNDPLAAFRNLLAPVEVRVSKLEKKFTSLEKTVRSIQSYVGMNGGGKSARSKSSSSYKQAPKSSSKSRSSNRSSVKIEGAESQVYVERPGRAPVSRVIIDQSGSAPRNDNAYGSYSEGPSRSNADSGSCNAQAIVHGRVWVKRADGSFVSYGEGDAWTNGGVIQSIDPSRGVQVGGRWLCM